MAESDINEVSEARAELLCYLVATLAASHSLTHEWRIDHVVESCRIWLRRNSLWMDWLERVRFGQLALKLAKRELKGAGIAVRQSNVQALFTGDMQLNYSCTVIKKMLALCRDAL
ncbi:hypothetical protein [Caballeronia grimmiae]|uniref:Uncharacterized protein n=1 Tax=Caballeronia grimmiae TaxID=1071679 RepID=A0A069N8A2_9BURK|nr:hypothetical protein [Caballeronia grimmiae]KDR24598.1 hypothetical protein BG57_05290 [Caballeronia grimmiae]GGD96893.1 hypothetical protein GCM10010985_59490 [Caballeronia grimmiae]